jgi:hypothetical protein
MLIGIRQDTKVTELLVEAGANLKHLHRNNWTAAHSAALSSSWKTMEYLYLQGADFKVSQFPV